MANRAKRDLEEARKSGVIPPEKDSATGELINPHIPEFMSKVRGAAAPSADSGAPRMPPHTPPRAGPMVP